MPSFVTAQTIEYFKPDSVANFALALQTEPKTISIPYKIDFEFKTAVSLSIVIRF
jgi:hypothetical protein